MGILPSTAAWVGITQCHTGALWVASGIQAAGLAPTQPHLLLCRYLSATVSVLVQPRPAAPLGLLQSPRCWLLLCVCLACQLLVTYVLK